MSRSAAVTDRLLAAAAFEASNTSPQQTPASAVFLRLDMCI